MLPPTCSWMKGPLAIHSAVPITASINWKQKNFTVSAEVPMPMGILRLVR